MSEFLGNSSKLKSADILPAFLLEPNRNLIFPRPAIPTVPNLLLCTLELHFRSLPMDNPCFQELMVRTSSVF